MHARVTLIEIDPVRIGVDEAVALFRDQVLSRLTAEPGYRGVYVLANPEGQGVLVSFWDTAEQAEAEGEQGLYPALLAEYVTLFRAPPGRASYAVALADIDADAVALTGEDG